MAIFAGVGMLENRHARRWDRYIRDRAAHAAVETRRILEAQAAEARGKELEEQAETARKHNEALEQRRISEEAQRRREEA